MTVRSGPLRVKYCSPDADRVRAPRTVHTPGIRVAYALSRRLGGAVVRNRLRRQLKAILTQCAVENADLLPEGDYLVSIQPSSLAKGSTATERKQAHSWSHLELSGYTHRALEKLQARINASHK